MVRVCYFIQSYKNFEQILRLVKTLRKSSRDAVILISHSVSGCALDEELLKQQNTFVLYVKGGRGNFTLVQNYLDAVEWLLTQNIEFDWFINLTGQDYPIQPIAQIEQTLAETEYDGFLEYFRLFSGQSSWGTREEKNRYYYRYHSVSKPLAKWQRKVLKPLKIINYIQPLFRIRLDGEIKIAWRTTTPFSKSFLGYGGSYFTVLSKNCVKYLYEFSKSNPHILHYFYKVCFPDEIFVQTILLNQGQFKLANESKHYFDFSNSHYGHPKILTASDYSILIEQSCFFARKFDTSQDSKILDLLDSKIGQDFQHPANETTKISSIN
ncbi:MAG: hypothetical protein Kow00121_46550 [Elainellaceae cyanobacterium]